MQFILCGEDVTWSNRELVALIDRLGLRRTVHLLGRREDVERILAALDAASAAGAAPALRAALGVYIMRSIEIGF